MIRQTPGRSLLQYTQDGKTALREKTILVSRIMVPEVIPMFIIAAMVAFLQLLESIETTEQGHNDSGWHRFCGWQGAALAASPPSLEPELGNQGMGSVAACEEAGTTSDLFREARRGNSTHSTKAQGGAS